MRCKSSPEPADDFALLRELTRQQLTWSFEGTTRAESVIQRVAAAYGAHAEVTFLADAAVLTVGERTASFSRTPIVPPLDQVSDFKRLLPEIEDGALSACMTVAALLLGRPRNRPPAYVLYLGAFYVLTPGSHGLRGFESWLGGHSIMGFQGLGDMIALMTALAAGMLVAAAAVRSAGR